MSEPQDISGDRLLRSEDIWRAWRDAMLAQGRPVASERMAFATLSDDDKALDDRIADRLVEIVETRSSAVLAQRESELAALRQAAQEALDAAEFDPECPGDFPELRKVLADLSAAATIHEARAAREAVEAAIEAARCAPIDNVPEELRMDVRWNKGFACAINLMRLSTGAADHD